jgi:hypothetical protein
MDEFLDRAAAQVDNYTANEANKVFVLVLAAVFERQLRVWAPHLLDAKQCPNSPGMKFDPLFSAITENAGIDLVQRELGKDLEEVFLVANVVRHGDGRSSTLLRARALHLWDHSDDYVDLTSAPSPHSEMLRVRPDDLARHVRAMVRYWGLADRQPMAVTEGIV